MPDEQQNQPGQAASADLPAAAPWHDVRTRSAHEIPKPKDWQALQRGCVLLFQGELKDPHVQEYGRNGQKQHGIDVLGRRDGNSDHYVGVQCRLLEKPMKKDQMLADCRAALSIKASLKEIIFATTCPTDTHATNAAIEVERELRAEGHDLNVALYSWPDIELKVAQHPAAYSYFVPGAAPLPAAPSSEQSGSAAPPVIAPFVAREPRDGQAEFRAPDDILGAVTNFPGPDTVVKLCRGPAIWFRLMPIVDPCRQWSVMDLKRAIDGTSSVRFFIRLTECTTCEVVMAPGRFFGSPARKMP